MRRRELRADTGAVFWTGNGVMEGKSAAQVKAKWEMAFVPAYTKSLCVFGPTQIVNFTLTPPQHRLAVQQLVGLGESSFPSLLRPHPPARSSHSDEGATMTTI